MIEEEKKLMEQHGISCELKCVYLYKGHKYEKLEDALIYAKIDSIRERELEVDPNVL